VVVLGQAERERERAQALAEVLERDPRRLLAVLAQVDGLQLDAERHGFVGEPELLVELQRPRLHDHGPRRLAGAIIFVDDAKWNAMAGQTQGQHEAGRSGADDEDLGGKHGRSPRGGAYSDPWVSFGASKNDL
jgi:hypothetical protein